MVGVEHVAASFCACLLSRGLQPEPLPRSPIHTNMPPKDLASPSQTSGTLLLYPASISGTFWTSCHRCRMQYKYVDIFLNQELLCRKCELPFMAIEVPPPTAGIFKPLSVPVPYQGPAASSDSTPVFDASNSGLGEERTIKKRRCRSKWAFPCRSSVGDRRLPFVTNTPRRPKELPREDIRRMLMDKARTEITRYLGV